MSLIKRIRPENFKELPADQTRQVVDVREPMEYAAEFLPGTRNLPLSRLEENAGSLSKKHPVYLICRSGTRAGQAAERLGQLGFEDVNVVVGGLEGCRVSGLVPEAGVSKIWSLERQVRLAAGLLVLTGVVLGYYVNPSFFILSGFIGAGLTFAALTDTCGMAMLLARMPWNQKAGNACSADSQKGKGCAS